MTDLATVRELLRQQDRQRSDRRDSGRLGEIIVEAWLRETCKLDVFPLPQGRGTKHLLLKQGGKRPDFLVKVGEDAVFIDSKLYSTDSLNSFQLDQKEIQEFRLAMQELEVEHLLIALVPRERVDRLFLIGLDEIAEANCFGPVCVFNLDINDDLRTFHITAEAYDEAVKRFRAEGYCGKIPIYLDEAARTSASRA